VEDDDAIADPLAQALEGHGYGVRCARDARSALETALLWSPALVLLDLGLPDSDGVDLCRRLRVHVPDAAIVIVTARRDEIDVVVGLDAGADDYVTKPFRLAELLARIRAHLRGNGSRSATLAVGDVRVERDARKAFAGEHELDLRPREFDLLALLVAEAGRALTRERIMTEVWDENWFGSTKTLDVHVSALRRKLGEGGSGERPVITALRGVGYRLDLP